MITLYKIFINMLYVKLIIEYFEILYFRGFIKILVYGFIIIQPESIKEFDPC
jgi:hypothetical protein